MSPAGDEGERPKRPERPEYTVYRSRPSLRDKLGKPDLSKLRGRLPRRGERKPRGPRETSPWRRRLKWAGIAALAWILISFAAFAISAQIQKGKLADGVGEALDGNPFMLALPQNILVLGTDIRSGAFAGPNESASIKCLRRAGSGQRPRAGCDAVRSDTIMVVRAGGGTFRKLSIPRDTLAEIPGSGNAKINAAYAIGGAKLTATTVGNFLGIDIDQIAIVDFDGFRNFIDTIGGVKVDLPTAVCTQQSGGAFNLDLKKGEHTLNGFQAITLARTRDNECGKGEGTGSDLERAQFQQLILDGIKGRLTSITRLPYNFIKGPFIGWDAPKAIVSSMGILTMPQLVLSAGIGGGGGTEVLKPNSISDPLIVSQQECDRKVKKLLGGDPPRDPACSPGG
jgi:LCP family protein required for cell wall assembly